jgi:hypothetical protein
MRHRHVIPLELVFAFALGFPSATVTAADFFVPTGYPTIQAAIDAAVSGDTVIVDAGTYRESINFSGKSITVRSAEPEDPLSVATTIIDGDVDQNPATPSGPVVTFENGETRSAVLSGFSLTGGTGKPDVNMLRWGGGVLCDHSSPTLTHLRIYRNRANFGAGIECQNGSAAFIAHNIIAANRASKPPDGGGGGGGIQCVTSPGVEIRNNLIINNRVADATGGGNRSL